LAVSWVENRENQSTIKMAYFCYIVQCVDGSFYTGWSVDPVRREKQHNKGIGAAYTRLHRPVHLVYIEEQPDLPTAMKRERAIKTLKRPQKEKLIQTYQNKD